jgi:hypothetical protein
MQMPWATRAELTEACPPAYGHFMGLLLMAQLRAGQCLTLRRDER